MEETLPIDVSVVVPAHDPDEGRLRRALLGLKAQRIGERRFEVIVVNNASARFPTDAFFDDCGLANLRLVAEPRLGLTSARLAGFAASAGALVILVDDDNVLAPDYLDAALKIASDHPFLASWSGNVELSFEPGAVPPPPEWRSYLTERACRSPVWSNDPSHNDSTPWGAGMCVRRALADAYRAHCARDPSRLRLDLSGKQLTYGGDTDIAYFGCGMGFGKGVFPQLKLVHLIPPERCVESYLLRAIEGHAYSEWLHHWVHRGVVPTEPGGLGLRLKRRLRLAFAGPRARATERARAAGHARAVRELGSPR